MPALQLRKLKNVLCLGAHSDDIEIGCGGTLLRLAVENPELKVDWVVFTAAGDRQAEAERSANDLLGHGVKSMLRFGSFRESYFPSEWEKIKDFIGAIRRETEPDIVFTHFRDDRHQDHRVISDLAWNAFRNHLILEYEIPKWDGDLGHPNCYVPLSPALVDRKVGILMRHFKSQQTKHWFNEELFRGLMRIRGAECAQQYAEAFHGRKMILG